MKSVFVSTLILTFSQLSYAQLSCELGGAHDKSVVKAVLADTIQKGRIQISAKSGSLRLSVSPVDILARNAGGTKARVTISRSYRNIQDTYGPALEQIEYITETTKSCQTVIVGEKKSGVSFPTMATLESELLKAGLQDMVKANDFVPVGQHSGSMSLVFKMPDKCHDTDADYSINIQRTHQHSGIVSRVSSYLIGVDDFQIAKKSERYGRILENLCL